MKNSYQTLLQHKKLSLIYSVLAFARTFCAAKCERRRNRALLVFIELFICYTGNDKLGGILWRNKNYY